MSWYAERSSVQQDILKKGTKVRIRQIGNLGYVIEDEHGNYVRDVPGNYVMKIS